MIVVLFADCFYVNNRAFLYDDTRELVRLMLYTRPAVCIAVLRDRAK